MYGKKPAHMGCWWVNALTQYDGRSAHSQLILVARFVKMWTCPEARNKSGNVG